MPKQECQGCQLPAYYQPEEEYAPVFSVLAHEILHVRVDGVYQVSIDTLVDEADSVDEAYAKVLPALHTRGGCQGARLDVPPEVQVGQREQEEGQVVQDGEPELHAKETGLEIMQRTYH
jgi:hypothetical protein